MYSANSTTTTTITTYLQLVSHYNNNIFTARKQSKIVKIINERKVVQRTDGGFPGGAAVENLPANAGDTCLSPGWEDPTCRRATRPVSHNY